MRRINYSVENGQSKEVVEMLAELSKLNISGSILDWVLRYAANVPFTMSEEEFWKDTASVAVKEGCEFGDRENYPIVYGGYWDDSARALRVNTDGFKEFVKSQSDGGEDVWEDIYVDFVSRDDDDPCAFDLENDSEALDWLCTVEEPWDGYVLQDLSGQHEKVRKGIDGRKVSGGDIANLVMKESLHNGVFKYTVEKMWQSAVFNIMNEDRGMSLNYDCEDDVVSSLKGSMDSCYDIGCMYDPICDCVYMDKDRIICHVKNSLEEGENSDIINEKSVEEFLKYIEDNTISLERHIAFDDVVDGLDKVDDEYRLEDFKRHCVKSGNTVKEDGVDKLVLKGQVVKFTLA